MNKYEKLHSKYHSIVLELENSTLLTLSDEELTELQESGILVKEKLIADLEEANLIIELIKNRKV